jgi:hypothetical protein
MSVETKVPDDALVFELEQVKWVMEEMMCSITEACLILELAARKSNTDLRAALQKKLEVSGWAARSLEQEAYAERLSLKSRKK